MEQNEKDQYGTCPRCHGTNRMATAGESRTCISCASEAWQAFEAAEETQHLSFRATTPTPPAAAEAGEAVGLEGQPCSAGAAVREYDASVQARPNFNSTLNWLEQQGFDHDVASIRNYVKHLVWWAQEEAAAARAARHQLTTATKEAEAAGEAARLLYGFLPRAHWHGWFSRERLDGPDRPAIDYPAGLDYEQKADYAYQEWHHLAAIDIIAPPPDPPQTPPPTTPEAREAGGEVQACEYPWRGANLPPAAWEEGGREA